MAYPDPPEGTDPGGDADEPTSPRRPTAQMQLADVLAAYRALKQENEGYRERMARNAERRFAQRHERLLLKFIDILDNLDRALEAAELSSAGGPLIEGLILVRTQLLQTLQEEGLERIGVMGLPYDPEVAEAVGTQPVEDPDHHHVVLKDIRRGYRLNGKLARAAQVIVGELREPAGAAASAPADASDESSGRFEVVADAERAEVDTGALEALAAEAAAAVGGGGDEGEEGDAALISDDESLEDAAREAAALADGDAETSATSVEPADDETEQEDLLGDEESLEDAARAAAALVGADEETTSEAEPQSTAGAEPTPDAAKKPASPAHPLDDIDPSAFEDLPEGDEE